MSSEDKVVDPEIQPKGIFVNEEGIRLDKPASYACAPEDGKLIASTTQSMLQFGELGLDSTKSSAH